MLSLDFDQSSSSLVMMQVNSFTCSYLSHQGRLIVSETELYFVSTLYRIDMKWGEILQIEMVSKHLQGKPATLISIKQTHQVQPHLFSNFRDVNSAEQQLQKYLLLSRARKADKAPTELGASQTNDSESPFVTTLPPADSFPAQRERVSDNKTSIETRLVGAGLLALLLLCTWSPWARAEVSEATLWRLLHTKPFLLQQNVSTTEALQACILGTAVFTVICFIVSGVRKRSNVA